MIHRYDFLIIGTGIAGLSYALKAARVGSVAIITKKEKAESNTNYAQGGVAAVMSAVDSFDLHMKDTLATWMGLSHRDAVEVMVREGPERRGARPGEGRGPLHEPDRSFERPHRARNRTGSSAGGLREPGDHDV